MPKQLRRILMNHFVSTRQYFHYRSQFDGNLCGLFDFFSPAIDHKGRKRSVNVSRS